MQQATKSDFMTTAETARELDITPSTVRYLENTKKLCALRTETGTRIFLRKDVERLKRERMEKGSRG
jgi:DNA-binding transcriptional MerR regulator